MKSWLKIFLFSAVGLISTVNSQLIRCSNNPCKNGGRCVDQPGTFYGYNCVCQGPWTGINCDQYKGNNNMNSQYNNYQNGYQNNFQNDYPYNNNKNNNWNNNQNNGNYNYNYNKNPYAPQTDPCNSSPCFNNAVCQPNGGDSYYCLCRYGYYGDRCEKVDNPKGKLLAIILGTILPFFAIVIIVAFIIFCCCNRRK